MRKMDTMSAKYLCFLVLVLEIPCLLARGDNCIQSDRTHRTHLKCPAHGQIVHVDMTAGDGKCHKPEQTAGRYRRTFMGLPSVTAQLSLECYGDTGSLMVAMHNCYWQTDCTVDFPKDPIIRVPEGNETCFAKYPDFISLKEYRCFIPTDNESELIDICSDLSPDLPEAGFGQGLIRSHDIYPWMYDPRELDPKRKSCSVNLYGGTGLPMVVSFFDIELGEGDAVELTYGGTTKRFDNSAPVPRSFMTSPGQVSVSFIVSNHSNGGRGFLMCFKFVRPGEPDGNVCDVVTSEGIAPVMISDESTATAKQTTVTPAREPATTPKPGTPKPGPECYNKKKKLKKKCRPPKKAKGSKGRKGRGKKGDKTKGKKKDKRNKDKKDRKRKKARRHIENGTI